MRLGLDATQAISLALLTQEPLAINFVHRRLAETSATSATNHQQMAALLLTRTRDVDKQLVAGGFALPSSDSLLARGRARPSRWHGCSAQGDVESVCRLTNDVVRTLYQLRRSHWDRAYDHLARRWPARWLRPSTAFRSTCNLAPTWQRRAGGRTCWPVANSRTSIRCGSADGFVAGT